jgi:hypothetical protein
MFRVEEVQELLLSTEWLTVNGVIAYKRIQNFTNAVKLRCIRKCLCKLDINGRIKLIRYGLE